MYLLTFIDDCSRYTVVFFLKHKSEVLEMFKKYVSAAENQLGKHVKCIRSDNGGEYTSKSLKSTARIKASNTKSRCPTHLNRMELPKEKNRTIGEAVRAMLHNARLPQAILGGSGSYRSLPAEPKPNCSSD